MKNMQQRWKEYTLNMHRGQGTVIITILVIFLIPVAIAAIKYIVS